MKVYKNGQYIEVEDIQAEDFPYEQRVVERIREKYSVDDELAILRQRYSKPLEFAEYDAFVEGIKSELKTGKI